MCNVYFISDLHLKHKHICRFSPNRLGVTLDDPDVHDALLLLSIKSRVTKRDVLWILGDVAFTDEGLELLKDLPCKLMLVRGNHDELPTARYLEVFDEVFGLVNKYGFWLSHAPIHPDELRGKKNIHGHVHNAVIPDNRYISVCVEALEGRPISLQELRQQQRLLHG